MARPDVSSAAAPFGLRRKVTMWMTAVAAVVAVLIFGHWTYLFAIGTSPLCLPKGVMIAEGLVLIISFGAVLLGAGLLALDCGLARLGLDGQRRLYVIKAIIGCAIFAVVMFDLLSRHSTSEIAFTLGTVQVTSRDMMCFLLGAVVWRIVDYGLASMRPKKYTEQGAQIESARERGTYA